MALKKFNKKLKEELFKEAFKIIWIQDDGYFYKDTLSFYFKKTKSIQFVYILDSTNFYGYEKISRSELKTISDICLVLK